ncbi:hypothetical protein HYPSUDRAFT_203789 [Hypholoma sublateritium FD-334 SS-4]|uniref:Extracellular metalloproteinase n=1 Tax=Hypholoma sublateritium (strain FD-334 SS-4) TaxID=945553 RepID=A0A0D2NVA7_HYPSF|nr:hypothetical protein HYPSUDRAFT_203789 [Hypholoma sublateritium FD-334 SS-4]
MTTFLPSTGRRIILSSGESVEYTDPTTIYETFGDGIDSSGVALSSSDSIEQAAISFVENYLGITSPMGVAYTSGYRTGKMTYAYVKQTDNGVPIANAVANIAWKGDIVVAFGHSFVEKKSAADTSPRIEIPHAISTAELRLNGTHTGHPTKTQYLATSSGHLALVHAVQIENDDLGTHYEAFVDAHSGQLLSLTDFYTVLPTPGGAAPPDGFQVLTDPADKKASPSIIDWPGWHSVSTTSTTTTEGNNVLSYKGDTSSTTSQSSATLNFNYAMDATKTDPADNVDAARVNAFYIANTVHDFLYRYGFTEEAFNFQQYNFNRGGEEGDRVLLSVQHSGLTNNANFVTPPDGQSGKCNLGVWDKTTPKRDGAFANSIIIHELTHGLTNRMTGGGTGHCLQSQEARGLGEGWSDAVADWAFQTSAPIQKFSPGVWVTGDTGRWYPNGTKYSDLRNRTEVHKIGQVWANILHHVNAALVDKYGFSTTAMTNPDGSEGNIVFLHLFIDALALQPVNPTFVFARQAWIQADANRYNGANEELLWTTFAKYGLGVGAANYNDSASVPSHFKPVVTYRGQTKLPPLAHSDICGVAAGWVVIVKVNPQTVVTLFGLVTASWSQKAKAELIDSKQNSKSTVFFDGKDKESLCLDSDSSTKSITWGPFDEQMTVELTFYHKTGVGASWDISAIKADKMKEYLDDDLKTAVTLIPIDDGGHGNQDYQNTTFNVTRMTYVFEE